MVSLKIWTDIHQQMSTKPGVRQGLEVYSRNYKVFKSLYGDHSKYYRELLKERDKMKMDIYLSDLNELNQHEFELVEILGLHNVQHLRQFVIAVEKYNETQGKGFYIGFSLKSLEESQ